jgi:hypothetical protein
MHKGIITSTHMCFKVPSDFCGMAACQFSMVSCHTFCMMQFRPKDILIPTILLALGTKFSQSSLLTMDRYPRLGLVAVLGGTNGSCNQDDWGSKQSIRMYLKYCM